MKIKRLLCFMGLVGLAVVAFPGQNSPIVVNSDKPLKGRLTVDATEKLRIRSDALGKDAYFAIDRYALSPLDENVYLLDAKDFALHVFDAAGKHVRVIRIAKGQGPGEFGGNFPLTHRAYPLGEGLWVEDYDKIALFDHQGKIIREKNKAGGPYALMQGLSAEELLVIVDERGARPTDMIRTFPKTQHLRLENWDGQALVRYFSSDKTGGWGNAWVGHVKDYRITPLILLDVDARGRKLVYAVSDEYVVTIKDLSGQPFLTIRRDSVPQKITGDMRRVIMASPYFQDLAHAVKANGQDFEKMMDMNQTWDHLNPIIQVQFLDDGMICVFVLKDVQGRIEADLFDQKGRWQATLEFPAAVQKLAEPRFQGNRLAGLGMNEEDGEYFYLEYSLKKSPSELIR